jgi:hypothetical protein
LLLWYTVLSTGGCTVQTGDLVIAGRQPWISKERTMKRTPSLIRIVTVDYGASLGALLPLVVWGLVLVGRLADPEAAAFFFYVAPAVTVGGLALLAWRVLTIRAVFSAGDEVPGVISSLDFFRGRGRIEYVYTMRCTRYMSSNALQLSAIVRSLAAGQEVTLAVDRFHPKRAFVHELYL